ncbi:nickel-responsive transcriptional regulator NikR [Brucella pseudogrignonensis]|uniref:nickel-responsive transcriptional regulator NikR n=1 Tax=Brucella TaxID=234 RepID=UPI0028B2C279|nr:nickel-responsive transcriptional regulator NikR [Brucella pseudogrignonensis]MDT6941034.1 nickel-responsive transcriptional regulator NikR [Brucella pseudogrignonensis]
MQRITITVDDDLMHDLDALIARKGYANRSEAVRDLVRSSIGEAEIASDEAKNCVGVLSYVYQHDARDLAKKLTASHHDHHHMSVASLHVHMNEELCLEVSLLRGEVKDVKQFANSIISQRAVVYGDVSIIPHEPHEPHDH